jgi:predicted O-methyltransferase YrrM
VSDWSRAAREAWLPAIFGLPAHPRLLARSLRGERLGFVRFWPRLRATVPGWTGVLEGRFLYMLARAGPGNGAVVEIGSAWGRATICLARGSKAAGREVVQTVDPHLSSAQPSHWRGAGRQKGMTAVPREPNAEDSRFPWLLSNLRRFGVDDWVVPIVSTSAAASTLPIDRVRLLFVDGSHDYEEVKADIEAWLPRVIPGGVIVFDDYFGTKPTWGVRRAVDELVSSGQVRPSLCHVGTHVWTVKGLART